MAALKISIKSNFEMQLAEISARLINLPSEQIDGAIENAQRRICEFLGLNVSALWQISVEHQGVIFLTHAYRRFEGPPVLEPMNA